MTAEEIANKHGVLNRTDSDFDNAIIEAMEEYAKIKCEQLSQRLYQKAEEYYIIKRLTQNRP